MVQVQAFHSDLSVKISINVTLNSTTGVKQGCMLTPIMFRVYIEAIDEINSARLESAGISHGKHAPFYMLKDFTMAGRKSSQLGAQFIFVSALFCRQ
jgi:hypothetical protein